MITVFKKIFSRKNAFLRKLLLTTVGLVCIPLIVIQLWIIRQSSEEYLSSSASAYISALQASSGTYRMQLDILSDSARQIAQNTIVQEPCTKATDVYRQLQAVGQLHVYKQSVPFVSDVAVYYKNCDFVLSASCKRSLITFCDYVTGGSASDTAQLYGFLDTLTKGSLYTQYSASNYLIFATPVSLHSYSTPDAVICFLLNTRDLARLYDATLPENTDFGIINNTGSLALSSAGFPADLLEDSQICEFLSDPSQSSLKFTLNEEPMNLYKYTDPATGDTMLACLSSETAEKPLVRYVNRLHITLVVSLFFMCLLLTITVYINYRPVQRLLRRHAPGSRDGNLSELEVLDSLFFAKDAQIANQENLLSSFLISDLLFGVEVDPGLLKRHFPADSYRHLVVAAVSRVQLSSSQTHSVASLLHSRIGSVEFCTTRLPNSPRTLFIFMSAAPLSPASLTDNLCFAVQKITGMDASVHMGIIVDSIEKLPLSHQSALASHDSFQQEGLPGDAQQLPAHLQQYSRQLSSGNLKEALSALELLEDFIASTVKAEHQNYHCHKVLSAYIKIVTESHAPPSPQELEPLITFQTSVQLFALLRQATTRFCTALTSSAKSMGDRQREKLLQYVNDNLTNRELCLSTAAEHMNLSIYAVSRLFKDTTGKNFKEYITLERLKIAHDLLLTTDQSISEIASAIGFEDSSYFSEVFKKHYHLVPTKYRLQSRQ